MKRVLGAAAAALVVASAAAVAAEKESDTKEPAKPKPVGPVTIVYKSEGDVEPKRRLETLEIGFEERGLFGTSFERLEKLPVRGKYLRVEFDFHNIVRIEVDAPAKKGAPVRLIVHTRADKPGDEPPSFEGVLDARKELVWRGTYRPAGGAVASFDLRQVKEIRFDARPKQEPPAG
jgi:hypothetical protein